MKSTAALVLAAASLLAATRAAAQLPAGNWGLRFADEFTGQGGSAGTNLDPVKWSTAYPWGRTHNYPAYIRDENITVANGTLNLQAKRESFGGQPFTSGAINSNGKFNFTYGYIEARMKLPAFLGAWPAFWMLQDGWPPELDVMEARYRSASDGNGGYLGYGDMYSYVGTYHWGADYTQEKSAGTGFQYPGGNLTDAFHNYGTLWAPDHVTFYFDGRDMGSVWSSAANIAQMRNEYLLLNLGVGGWPGDPPSWEGMGPAFRTDWVRVWQQTPGTTQSNWSKAASGNQNWDDAANWSAGVPQLASQSAFLGPVAATDVRLDWAGNKVIGALTFQSATNYTVGWSDDSLMLAAPLGQTRAYVNGYNQSGQGRMAISSRVELYSDVSVRNWLDNPIVFNAAIIGTGEFSAEQPGGVVLNGPGSYTGATRVKDDGKLTINAALTGTSNLFINKGSATISSTGAVTTANYSSIGQNAGDVATLDLQGNAQLTVNGDLNVADVAATGTMNIAGNAQVKARSLFVGKFGAANGTVNQTGGAVTSLAGGGDWRIGGASSPDTAAVGVYNLQAGTVSTANNLQVGAYGRGTLTQTGGAVTTTGYLAIGRYAGGAGTYDASAGNGALTANTQLYLIVAEQGTGTLLAGGSTTINAKTLSVGHNGGVGAVTQTGGTVNAPAGVALGLLNATGRGTYTLSGGTLNTSSISRGLGSGTFNFNGGTLRATSASAAFLQGLTAANLQSAGGTIDTNGFDVAVAQPLAGPGALTKTGPGTLTLSGANTFAGNASVTGGTLAVNGALASGASVSAGARLAGSGTIAGAVDSSGEIAPGNSPGQLRAASARFRGTSTFTVELAGPANYDAFSLTGPATLDLGATLAVQLPGGYTPAGGQSFDILSYTSATGRFSNYTGVDLGGGLVLAPFYLDNALRLVTTIRGDANGDGQVTFDDYQRLQRGYGKPGGWQQGDFNLDGLVDASDVRLLYDNLHKSVSVAAPLPAHSVPEPTTLALVVVSALASRRPRRQ